ncbi:glycosyltransferase family 2 protein [Tetragenococcus halophilus]|uniref:Glycosyltransferase n=1 Tax=Tetragenococcus halophilus TaxID=51669 RepID=A0AB37D247_TETHA|nr:glycosyltransferase family 2 protein [Tetragenococcus halophilus]QGP76218.1 glycosyltransferase [Tetragenococcus halophilus]QGP76232.1 glycosyltransferase [Tetragenococcus halophilus]
MSITVSVIIPTYNAKNSIKKAIDSVLQQTYQDFEIIIVDDCSKDNTYELLKMIAKIDSRISVYQNKHNSKSAFTRNRAIELSQGQYIMQLDDDDYCDKNRMEKQVRFLEKNRSYDFVGSNALLFDDKGVYGSMEMVEKPDKYDLKKTSAFINPSVMFRKSSLEKIDGYRVSKETVRAQDYDLYLRMYVADMKGYNIQENLVYYYKDMNSFNKSSIQYRYGEAKFRYRNFKKLGLLPQALLYVVKPILASLIPNSILAWKHKKRGITRG